MGFKDDFDALWAMRRDKEIAVGIRSDAESIYNQIDEWIQNVIDNSGIDINEDIRDDFIELLTVMQGIKADLIAFSASHPEFMGWRP